MLPRVPVRQWVFAFPRRIRWHLGNDPDLMASALNIFLRALFTFHRRRARRLGVVRPSCGSITFVQRFGSALQSNVHFHVLVPDAVFGGTYVHVIYQGNRQSAYLGDPIANSSRRKAMLEAIRSRSAERSILPTPAEAS